MAEGGMDDLPVEVRAAEKQSRVKKLQDEIHKNTGLRRTDDEQNRRVTFFPDTQINLSNAITPNSKPSKEAARAEKVKSGVEHVVTNLAHTLGDIGLDALDQYMRDASGSEEYMTVAETVSRLASVIKATGEGNIHYTENTGQENHIRNRGNDGEHAPDEVRIFSADGVEIDGKQYDKIKFFIRPRQFIRNMESRSGAQTSETRQDRTTIEVQSPDLPNGTASIRIDPPSPYSGGRLTYDVIVGGNEENVIHNLDLGKAGQHAGHHFESQYKTEEDLALKPWQIHEGIASRLTSLTDQPQAS